MIFNKEEILSILKNLKSEIKTKYRVKNLGLFGSYVKKEQKEARDIDILVEFEEDADLFHLIGLSLFLEENFNIKVDVVSKSALKKELRDSILQEVIYA
ncbi:MAG: nucleotidyltransferase family protein [Promethearchaeota archaeon]